MSSDQFRLWVSNFIVWSVAAGAVIVGLSFWPTWAVAIIAIVLAILFPIVPWAYTDNKEVQKEITYDGK